MLVRSDTTLFELIAAMQRGCAEFAVVLPTEPQPQDVSSVLGVVTKTHLAEALAEGMEIFGD